MWQDNDEFEDGRRLAMSARAHQEIGRVVRLQMKKKRGLLCLE